MSALLRHPATVPALFSRALDEEEPARRAAWWWSRAVTGAPAATLSREVLAASTAGFAALAAAPLLKAASRLIGAALSG